MEGRPECSCPEDFPGGGEILKSSATRVQGNGPRRGAVHCSCFLHRKTTHGRQCEEEFIATIGTPHLVEHMSNRLFLAHQLLVACSQQRAKACATSSHCHMCVRVLLVVQPGQDHIEFMYRYVRDWHGQL